MVLATPCWLRQKWDIFDCVENMVTVLRSMLFRASVFMRGIGKIGKIRKKQHFKKRGWVC